MSTMIKRSAHEANADVDLSDKENLAIAKDPECLTIISPLINVPLFEFHRQRLAEKGYILISRIVKHQFQMASEDGSVTDLLGGESYYAATYTKRKP